MMTTQKRLSKAVLQKLGMLPRGRHVLIECRYQSHYVLTDRKGYVSKTNAKEYFDELVITQESQVIPAYIIRVSKANLGVPNSSSKQSYQ